MWYLKVVIVMINEYTIGVEKNGSITMMVRCREKTLTLKKKNNKNDKWCEIRISEK